MALVLADVANLGSPYVPPTLSLAALIASFTAAGRTFAAWDAAVGVTTAGGSVSLWEDQIGSMDLTTPASDPTHDEDDGGYASVLYDPGGTTPCDHTFGGGALGGSWAVALRVRRDAASSCTPVCVNDAAGSATGRAGIRITDSAVYAEINPNSGGDVAATDTFTVGTGWRTYILTFDGATYRLRVDSRTAQTVASPGAITASRFTLGILRQAASYYFAMDGAISHGTLVTGGVWTNDEETALIALLGAV